MTLCMLNRDGDDEDDAVQGLEGAAPVGDLPVRHTASPSVLYDGAGHIFGSSLPVGGAGLGSRRPPMVV